MEENLNIFGKNLGEIGSLDKNLVLRTKGQVYIRFGRKYIELLDNKGNLNVKIPKFIFKVNSESEMKSNGIYLLDDNVYVYYDGDIILLTGTESEFVSYAIELNLTQEQINIAQNNIGLTFNSIDEALQTIDEGIFFVGDSIYYTKDGEYVELTFTLNYPLKDINEAELTRYPQGNYQTIVFINGRWVYSSIVTKEEFNSLDFDFTLNTPLLEINNASELQTLPDKLKEEETPSEEPSGDPSEDTPSGEPTGDDVPSEEDPDYKNMPWAIVYKGNDAWAYEKVVPYSFFLEFKKYMEECCEEVKEALEELQDETKTFTVTWLDKNGNVFKTTTEHKGNIALRPSESPKFLHYKFIGWNYDDSPIIEDISIASNWEYISPKLYIECDKPVIEAEGDENVKISYWVEWVDEDLNIIYITEGISVEGEYFNISFEEKETYIENNKVIKVLLINPTYLSIPGTIIFNASFVGDIEDIIKSNTSLTQNPIGALVLPDFDIMKFSIKWEGGGDLDTLTCVDKTGININNMSIDWSNKSSDEQYQYFSVGFNSRVTYLHSPKDDFDKLLVCNKNSEIANTKINLFKNETKITYLYNFAYVKGVISKIETIYPPNPNIENDGYKFDFYISETGEIDEPLFFCEQVSYMANFANFQTSLDLLVGKNIILYERILNYGEDYRFYLHSSYPKVYEYNNIRYGEINENRLFTVNLIINMMNNGQVPLEIVIDHLNYSEDNIMLYDLYQYLVWTGDKLEPGGEYTYINIKNILNNVSRFGLKCIYIYILTKWYNRTNLTGNFDIEFDTYKFTDETKCFYSTTNRFDLIPEDSSIENVTSDKLSNINNGFEKEKYLDPVATLCYNLETQKTTFYRGYVTDNSNELQQNAPSFVWN